MPLTQKRGELSYGGISLVLLEGTTVCAEIVVTNASTARTNVTHVRYIAIIAYACSRSFVRSTGGNRLAFVLLWCGNHGEQPLKASSKIVYDIMRSK